MIPDLVLPFGSVPLCDHSAGGAIAGMDCLPKPPRLLQRINMLLGALQPLGIVFRNGLPKLEHHSRADGGRKSALVFVRTTAQVP